MALIGDLAATTAAAIRDAGDQLITQTRRLSLDVDCYPPSHEPPSPPTTDQPDCIVHALHPGHPGHHRDRMAVGVAADARPAAWDGSDNVQEQSTCLSPACPSIRSHPLVLAELPLEIIFNILEFLDVSDVLSTSRTCRQLRLVSLDPLLHTNRLRRVRELLPPLLWNPERPSLANLISRSIFLTHTSVVSRRLARSLVSIRLARRLATRPSPEALVERAVLPKECVPGLAPVQISPTIVQRRMTIERERVKDSLRRWVEGTWRGEVREREESQRQSDQNRGVGRVWRLRRFWERIGNGEQLSVR